MGLIRRQADAQVRTSRLFGVGGIAKALGLGIWLAICTKQDIRLGLLGSFVVLAAVIVGRITGIALDGGANLFLYLFLAAQVLFFLATWYALRLGKKRSTF